MAKIIQSSFLKSDWQHRYCHGGVLRRRRAGRGSRALSTRDPLHFVFKIDRHVLRHGSLRSSKGFPLVSVIIRKYAKYFFVKIEQVSIQHDHIHILARCGYRSHYHHFQRVVAGQIAQQFGRKGLLIGQGDLNDENKNEAVDSKRHSAAKKVTDTIQARSKKPRLWLFRPFSRVVVGYKAYKVVKNYIQLNEKEVRQELRYQKKRLRGLSSGDWQILWS